METRILFEAEAQVAARAAPSAPAYVLAADGWHPGVIGIVASRIAERHHRPAVLIALDGEEGTGSGRSIPAFDLLGGLDAARADLLRHGGHRAAAGLTIERGRRRRPSARRSSAHAAAVLRPADLVPVAAGGRRRARRRAAPRARRGARAPGAVRDGQPGADAARPERAARRPAADGGGAARRLHARGRRRALALRVVRPRRRRFRPRRARPWTPPSASRSTATTARSSRGSSSATPARPRPARSRSSGEPPFAAAVLAELERRSSPGRPPAPGGGRPAGRRARSATRARRGIAGLLGDLVACGEPVLAVSAHAGHRAPRRCATASAASRSRRWAALEDDPALAAPYAHVVADRPAARTPHAARSSRRARCPAAGWTHLAWGGAEVAFARRVLAWELDLRAPLADLFRALRKAGPVEGPRSSALLRGAGAPAAHRPRSPAACCASLAELGLAEVERAPLRVRDPGRPAAHGARALAHVPRVRVAAGGRPGAPGCGDAGVGATCRRRRAAGRDGGGAGGLTPPAGLAGGRGHRLAGDGRMPRAELRLTAEACMAEDTEQTTEGRVPANGRPDEPRSAPGDGGAPAEHTRLPATAEPLPSRARLPATESARQGAARRRRQGRTAGRGPARSRRG